MHPVCTPQNYSIKVAHYSQKRHPVWGAFSGAADLDSKGRLGHSPGKKVSGGHFFSPWENPSVSERIPQGMWAETENRLGEQEVQR